MKQTRLDAEHVNTRDTKKAENVAHDDGSVVAETLQPGVLLNKTLSGKWIGVAAIAGKCNRVQSKDAMWQTYP